MLLVVAEGTEDAVAARYRVVRILAARIEGCTAGTAYRSPAESVERRSSPCWTCLSKSHPRTRQRTESFPYFSSKVMVTRDLDVFRVDE